MECTWWTQSVMPQSILSQASTVRSRREVRPAATFSTRKAALCREKSLMSLLDRRLELEPYMTLGGRPPCMQLELLLCVAVSQSRVQKPLISTSGKYWCWEDDKTLSPPLANIGHKEDKKPYLNLWQILAAEKTTQL